MRKLFLTIALAGVLAVPSLQAGMQVSLLQNTSQYSSGSGGEFRAVDVGNPSLLSAINPNAYSGQTSGTDSLGRFYFQTFCIEYNEHFNPGGTYDASISPNAMYGNQPTGGDPVSIGTAWLYSQFARGTLAGYNYTYGTGRSATAGALQNVIWWLENEPVGVVDPGIGNVFRNAVLAQFGSYAAAIADANGAWGVRALNLGQPGYVQDQLVIVPEPTTVIAGALLLLPFAASTIRRFRRNS